MTTEIYRGQEIDALPVGLRTWRAQVNGHHVGDALGAAAALRMARKWVDDELWRRYSLRPRAEEQLPRGAPMLTVIKGGIDA